MPPLPLLPTGRGALLLVFTLLVCPLRAATLWIEAERPAQSQVTRHPWWYDKVKTSELSGGDFLSHWDEAKAGELEYRFTAPSAGSYTLWIRANPIQSALSYSLNAGRPQAVSFQAAQQSVNIAADDKPDLRFLAWIEVGSVPLTAGTNLLRFQLTSSNHHHGMLDCLVLSNDGFQPDGIRRPGAQPSLVAGKPGAWFNFAPGPDSFRDSPIDLRWLNERQAGEKGRIVARGAAFAHEQTGEEVRFWAVNGPPHELKGQALKTNARRLAKYGVNLVRTHGAIFNKAGDADPAKISHAQEVVAAMKAEGIYTHFSIYFPLWMTPPPDHPWLRGYDGKKHPFAALMFNPEFQKRYRDWWKALLLTPDASGHRLVDDPAVFGLEIQNEDSFFFWTFNPDQIPDAQMRHLETLFGDWLRQKYGSLEKALAQWNGQKAKRDNLAEGRVGFRPLYNLFSEKSARDRDTARFLFELQQKFYAETYAFLRSLGFKGLITASNWATASPEVFGPLEKWSYASTDFIDRHGYFGVTHKGENSEWSIRNGHTYSDRSALRFENSAPGKARQFVHPAMDPTYAGKPSMISETTWNRPNRYRSEAPLYFACYGALQGSDAIVHFALDGDRWSVKPGYFMQPWTLMAPSQMAQFPAAALLFRQGLVHPGEVLARVRLNTNDLLHLKGTPLPQDANFDELRLKDVPTGPTVQAGQRIDPLLHYAGRVEVEFTGEPGQAEVADLKPLLDRPAQTVRSSTRELTLDYGKGLLTVNAPAAQGASGHLQSAGKITLSDLTVECPLDNAHLLLVSLDGQPIAQSRRLLLQVMSEETATDFATADAGGGLKRITNIGRDPWQVKALAGTVTLRGTPGRFQPLDGNGYPTGKAIPGPELKLAPDILYYEVTR